MKITLSETQTAKLFPLQAQIEDAFQKNPKKKGMILAQILAWPDECMEVAAEFIKTETANKIITILKEDGYGD